jgi:predicted nuclease with TOPRIM domain
VELEEELMQLEEELMQLEEELMQLEEELMQLEEELMQLEEELVELEHLDLRVYEINTGVLTPPKDSSQYFIFFCFFLFFLVTKMRNKKLQTKENTQEI